MATIITTLRRDNQDVDVDVHNFVLRGKKCIKQETINYCEAMPVVLNRIPYADIAKHILNSQNVMVNFVMTTPTTALSQLIEYRKTKGGN